MTLLVGYAVDAITPDLERPVFLAGFGRNRRAVSVHDNLYVRALALQQGETRVAVLALDLIGLGRRHCLEIEQRVNKQVPGARLLIACTHTHHGPDTIGLWGPDEATTGVDPQYVAELQERIVASAIAALQNLQPALLRRASTQVASIAKNGRDPQIRDLELTCLQFCHQQTGRPLTTWLTYPCHPEVLWEDNLHITSDYLASLRQVVEEETGAPCLATVGALGGMMTPDMPGHTFVDAEQMGQVLARAARAALAQAEARPAEPLACARLIFTIPLTNPLFLMAAQAGLLDDVRTERGEVVTEANLLRLGDTWQITVPGELLPKLGLAMKAQMRQAGAQVAAVLGLVNDELGYILAQEDFRYPDNPLKPGEHYEETMSVGPEAGPRLMNAFKTLLEHRR